MVLYYGKNGENKVRGFSDSDWAQEKPEKKSIGGFGFTFAGGTICFRSKKQSIVAQSAVQAEFIALSDAVREVLWIKMFQEPVGIPGSVFSI